jgi:hypothetical protein
MTMLFNGDKICLRLKEGRAVGADRADSARDSRSGCGSGGIYLKLSRRWTVSSASQNLPPSPIITAVVAHLW